MMMMMITMVKFILEQTTKARRLNATPRTLYRREKPGTHCTGGWVGPRAGLYRCGKFRHPPAFDPRTVQPVASRYTDWAIPARKNDDDDDDNNNNNNNNKLL